MRMLAPLLAVQRARRKAAENDLAAARLREQAELEARREAVLERDSAAADWDASLKSGFFAPELSAAFARSLIEREGDVERSALRVSSAGDIARRRLQAWQRLEAQLRAGEERHKRLRRRCARADEEARAAELADRTTWSRLRS